MRVGNEARPLNPHKEDGSGREGSGYQSDGEHLADSILLNVAPSTNKTPIRPYEMSVRDAVLAMDAEEDETRTRPFLQRIQLEGPDACIVRATAQVDDGASRNCISKTRWMNYAHCLGELQPTRTVISVANNTKVKALGRWYGIVRMGGTSVRSHFEVFECNDAFDIILGKPWLKDVRAIHDYATDELTIGAKGQQEVITSMETERGGIDGDNQLTETETDPEEQLLREEVRVHLLHESSGVWAETRWAQYLTVDEMEKEEKSCPKGVVWFTSRKELAEIRERGEREDRQKEKERALQEAVYEEMFLIKEARRVRRSKRRREEVGKSPKEQREKEIWEAAHRWRERRRAEREFQGDRRNAERWHEAKTLLESEARIQRLKAKLEHLRGILDLVEDTGMRTADIHALGDVTEEAVKLDRGPAESQRKRDPFAEDRVREIVEKVQLGPDLTDEQRDRVRALITEFADIFALSLSEVWPVDWHKHHLNVDPSIGLPRKIGQRPLQENQKEWFFKQIDEMEAAHIVQRVPGEFIKCLNSTNLQPKEAGKIGATRAEILRKVNAECQRNGLPPFWEEVPEGEVTEDALLDVVDGQGDSTKKTKWRICHAFTALNKATQVPAFPQGDLKSKHEFASGQRWRSVIDLASGYYAVPLDDDSVPYVAFYVEGRGYYVYLRMPFGLTGAPSTFCELLAIALDDMIGRELVNWMDDICLPGDDFDVKLSNLRKFFQRCRDRGLNLSPTKTKLFFTEVLFAGVMVGPDGIKPNLDKVAALVDWPVPEDVQDLMGFLGLTNYFRRLIKDYARIAAPLTDLLRDVQVSLPKGAKGRAVKGAYKRALKNASLRGKWGEQQQKAFVTLKCLLSEEPVLKPPQYDGRLFRVTSDGSKEGFAGFLSQPFTTVEAGGREVVRWHPISYCSKRTSRSEARYEPFLLEFAALKFCLDEFDPYIYGSQIEIETDCQALRDCLLKEKMSIHHSRWKESILAHSIIDIRHRPGVENPVADGLSRKWTNRKRTDIDGSSWSVLPDWEARTGITNDIMQVTTPEESPTIPVLGSVHPLEARFGTDIFFAPIVRHLLGKSAGDSVPERRQARKRSQGFMIEGDKLWRLSTKASERAVRTECIPREEGFARALSAHQNTGHFGVDPTKLHLRDRYFWPGMDADCKQAMLECPQCKNFGAPKLNSLLQPIRRAQPFELVAGDYLSLPIGKGGFKTVGLYIDTFSGFLFYSKLKTAGTGKATVNSLRRICLDYATPTTFMADGGSHFDNKEVDEFCNTHGIHHITTPAYAPWVNGLIESSNKLLLGRLKRLCAPNLDANFDGSDVDPKSIPENWPEHLDEAIRQLNDRILSALSSSPRELLFGIQWGTNTNARETVEETSQTDTQIHFTLVDSYRANAHQLQLEEADRRKGRFDEGVSFTEFDTGSLVQVYDSPADQNYRTINKLKPRWSPPLMVTGKYINSYLLCTLDGTALKGTFHARRLRKFVPLRGSTLDQLTPQDESISTEADLEIATAEERMASDPV